MRSVSAKFMPKLLTIEQKQLCLKVSQDTLDYANSDPEFLDIVITGDESLFMGTTRKPRCSPNQDAAVTAEIFNIPENKKGQASAEQLQSDVDQFFFLPPWGGASRVRTTRPKY